MNKMILVWILLIAGLLVVIIGDAILLSGKLLDEIKALLGGLGFQAWLPIILSFVAVCVSGYTLWSTRLAPFDLNVVSTGRVVLTSNPLSPGARQPAISVQLLFTNNGAKQGYVNDVALVLRKLDSEIKPVLFRSLYEHIEDSLNFTNQLPPPKMIHFISFPVKPGETIAKKVVFVPFDFQTEVNYERAKYSVTPYVIESGKKWKAWNAVDIDITQEDLQSLGQTVATPVEGGRQFVKWVHHSKPTTQQEASLSNLKSKIEK
ncbi:MAG: hypothetical protein M3416_14630 [Acidobacteriota bacterium]|nr:hypothetical protein [Acidobacteriota bacterium]